MSGAPTETELQTQWRNAVDMIESTRAYADDSLVGAGNLMDTLVQSLEGEYTPTGLVEASQAFRETISSLVSPNRVLSFLVPVLHEYGTLIDDGGGYSDITQLVRALYEHFHTNSLAVETRAITYDTTATAGGANVGNGSLQRLTVDENGYNLEACTVETKRFRCRIDQNTGAQKHGETFDCLGEAASQDHLLRGTTGSGIASSTAIVNRHSGTGSGRSILRNSTFSSYTSGAATQFANWTEVSGSANIDQDTTNYYQTNPGVTTDASLKLDGDAKLTQSLQVLRPNPNLPYFLRVMVNKDVHTGDDGDLIIRLGSQTVTTALGSIGAGWDEIVLPFDENCWFKNWNEDGLDIEIEWAGSSSGSLLIDDIILCPWTQIDGTWWILRQNGSSPTAWLRDDTLEFTDTDGAPGTGKIQYWMRMAGLGYLPSATTGSGNITFADPS